VFVLIANSARGAKRYSTAAKSGCSVPEPRRLTYSQFVCCWTSTRPVEGKGRGLSWIGVLISFTLHVLLLTPATVALMEGAWIVFGPCATLGASIEVSRMGERDIDPQVSAGQLRSEGRGRNVGDVIVGNRKPKC
jgi:hypothetical protein